MADQVRIKKGSSELTVSRKSFNAIYREKGFVLVREDGVGEESVARSSESVAAEVNVASSKRPAPRVRKSASRKTASKSKSGAKTTAAPKSDESELAAPEEG
jgi:hypothetical protein